MSEFFAILLGCIAYILTIFAWRVDYRRSVHMIIVVSPIMMASAVLDMKIALVWLAIIVVSFVLMYVLVHHTHPDNSGEADTPTTPAASNGPTLS